MKPLMLLIVVLLLVVDGMLAYDPFDLRNYSLGDMLGLALVLFFVGYIAWSDQTKKTKSVAPEGEK